MKKVILAALNAKYIHSNLALRYLSRFQNNNQKHHVETMEFTINQRLDFSAEELFRNQPDVVLFSCYIWNVEMLRQLCPILKKKNQSNKSHYYVTNCCHFIIININ